MDGAAGSVKVPSEVQGICLAGWHLPSDGEWQLLSNYLIQNSFGYQGSGGDIAKSVSSKTNWSASSKEGTPGNDPASNNSIGFSGLPGYMQYAENQLNYIGREAHWWTSAENVPGMGHTAYLIYDSPDFHTKWGSARTSYGLSVRCVKND